MLTCILLHDFHYFNVDFVLFHNVIYYTNPLLSDIQVNNTTFHNIMCTLVVIGMILGRLENCTGKLQAYGIKALDFCHSKMFICATFISVVNFSLET